MKTKRLIVTAVVEALLVLLGGYFEPTHLVRGRLWSEAFFQDRPTSYWRSIVVRDLRTDSKDLIDVVEMRFVPPNWWARFKNRIGYRLKVVTSRELVTLNKKADVVLKELAQDENKSVADFARDTQYYSPWQSPDHFWMTLIMRHSMRSKNRDT